MLWNADEGAARGTYEAMAESYRKLCRRTKPQNIVESWRESMGLSDNPAMEKLSSAAVFYKTMGEMLENLAFGQEGDLKRCGGKTYTSDAVTLMTLHGSKGLEFPAVILYGVKKGMVPLEYGQGEADVEEERRLLYVGITRAREELIMTESGKSSLFTEGLSDASVRREKSGQKNAGWDVGRQINLFEFMD